MGEEIVTDTERSRFRYLLVVFATSPAVVALSVTKLFSTSRAGAMSGLFTDHRIP